MGVITRPHGLRHTAITTVLDRNGGNVREGARFSRHKNLDTLGKYDDNRRDLRGQMASLVALPERELTAPARGSPRGQHWEAFVAWVQPGTDPMETTAEALATFVNGCSDRRGAWAVLGTLRPWTKDEVATMKRVLGR